MKLIDLTEKYKLAEKILNELLENNEITQDDLEDSLSAIDIEFDEKVLSIVNYIAELEMNEKALKDRIIILNSRRRALLHKIESLKSFIKSNMELLGKNKIEGLDYVIRVCKSSDALRVIDETAIPKNYFNTEIFVTLDEARLKQDLKINPDIDGAELVSRTHLRIQ